MKTGNRRALIIEMEVMQSARNVTDDRAVQHCPPPHTSPAQSQFVIIRNSI